MNHPINTLPQQVQQSFKDTAEYLLNDLAMYHLETVLVPAPEPKHIGHMVRMPINRNAGWWSELYSNYGKKLDRKCFTNALHRILEGRDKLSVYDCYARQQIKNFCVKGLYGEPDTVIVNYFNNQRTPK